MVFLHQSNRLENLFEQLLKVTREPLADPFSPEIIVVQNHGMSQWVTLRMAAYQGIAANLSFPFPARLIWELFDMFQGETPTKPHLTRQVICWRLFSLLGALTPALHVFQDLSAYLEGEHTDEKRYQLAVRIADVFDQYLVYRPDLLAHWENGGDNHWQACLWRQLSETAVSHQARLLLEFRRLLTSCHTRPTALPQRISLFGINALAPAYMEIFARISRFSELHLFHLSPCRHYWGDLYSSRQVAGMMRNQPPAAAGASLYYDQGNPLLASLGRTGQDFFRQLQEWPTQENDLHAENGQDTLLASLQNDLLDLCDRSGAEAEPFALARDDRSIQFHVCHSPLREVQILHDRLLECFETYPDLQPGDILVTAPDIQVYTAAISSVFGAASQGLRIPWSIADRTEQLERPSVRCFLALLALLPGRLSAPEVMALLEFEPLRRRFGLDPSAIPRLRAWVRNAQIRWGLDRQHRQHLGMDTGEQHTWRFGLDRLLLGYLMGDSEHAYGDILPLNPTGTDVNDLGGITSLIETLRRWSLRFHGRYSAEEWCSQFQQLADDLLLSDREEEGIHDLRQAFITLAAQCAEAGITETLSPAIVRTWLQDVFTMQNGGQAFLNGKVTFCNMIPMRSIPFRIIYMLGMNDTDFPRIQHPPEFDLIARAPRLGDRCRRDDDRYLFLEALLSARDVLAISWTGRNLYDETLAPPSVVVSELQEYIDQSCFSEDRPPSAQLTTVHPMQPFSRHCFDGTSTTGSYAATWLPSAHKETSPPFLACPLPSRQREEVKIIDISQLVRFWQHPVHYFLRQSLGLKIGEPDPPLEENEPFCLDQLAQFHLRQAATRGLLNGQSTEQLYAGFHAGALLPHGGFGRHLFSALADASLAMVDLLRPLLATPLPPLEVDCTLGPFRLTGWLTSLFPHGRVTWRNANLKAAALMELWVHHLALNVAAPASCEARSMHAGRDGLCSLSPVTAPEDHLQVLLEHYEKGLRAPLSFFPETSRAHAAAVRAGKGKERQAALAVWKGGQYQRGECQDPGYAYFFDDTLPLDSDFAELASLFDPIFTHLEASRAAA